MDWHDREMIKQLEQAALLGELARPLVHEINNFLNTLLLHIALLETTSPVPLHSDLGVIRQEGKKVARIVQDWQLLRKTRPDRSKSIDLNQVIRDLLLDSIIVHEHARLIVLELLEGPLLVRGAYLELRFLCCLLIQGALKGSDSPITDDRKVHLRTQVNKKEASLTIVTQDPSLTPQALAELFEPASNFRSGLEFAVCKGLAERLQGSLRAVNLPQGGIAVSFVTQSASI